MNLKALKLLYPSYDLYGIEINDLAVESLTEVIPSENIYHTSILDYTPENIFELVLIKGVLIHINPDELTDVYSKLVSSCGRYLLVAEYYNPTPMSITYRGHNDRLFKRDFAGEIMDRYPEMQLIDYGFAYHRDPVFPQGDVNWFLMEKRSDS
jgi:spore coat polysaccharide biosynthesis protein SpsF